MFVSTFKNNSRDNNRKYSSNSSLSISAAPFVARMIEGALNEVDRGLIEASSSMGASNSTIILKVMIPETMPHIIHGITVTVISLIGFQQWQELSVLEDLEIWL